MATGVGKSRRVRLNEASGCNAILSRDVASHDILDWWYYSRGISSTRMAKPMHGTSHQQKAETGAASLKAIPPAKRRHILPIVLLLLMLVACRPCHGHDRELFDMDNEDGKFSKKEACLLRLNSFKASRPFESNIHFQLFSFFDLSFLRFIFKNISTFPCRIFTF